MSMPQVLGSYELEALIGEGSMGRVYSARHVLLDRRVALKVLKEDAARDAEFVQRFFQEAKSVNQINHQHIVEIFDFVEDAGGQVYCVMELLHGETLSSLIARGPVPLERLQRIAVQICAALDAAHRVGVVHRDLKPDNIFVTQRPGQPDFVKVVDFGVAKLMSAVPTRSTLEGTLIGTPTYMAPEQAAGLPVDARADIYAMGNVLYEMMTGTPPFGSTAIGQLVVQIITQPVPPLPDLLGTGERIPRALSSLTLRCLSKDPEKRPASLAEVTTSLLMIQPDDPDAPAFVNAARARMRAHPRQLAGLVAVVALGLCAGALALNRSTPHTPVEMAAQGPAAVPDVSELPAAGSVVPAVFTGETSAATRTVRSDVPSKSIPSAKKSPARAPVKNRGARDAIIDPFAP